MDRQQPLHLHCHWHSTPTRIPIVVKMTDWLTEKLTCLSKTLHWEIVSRRFLLVSFLIAMLFMLHMIPNKLKRKVHFDRAKHLLRASVQEGKALTLTHGLWVKQRIAHSWAEALRRYEHELCTLELDLFLMILALAAHDVADASNRDHTRTSYRKSMMSHRFADGVWSFDDVDATRR